MMGTRVRSMRHVTLLVCVGDEKVHVLETPPTVCDESVWNVSFHHENDVIWIRRGAGTVSACH